MGQQERRHAYSILGNTTVKWKDALKDVTFEALIVLLQNTNISFCRLESLKTLCNINIKSLKSLNNGSTWSSYNFVRLEDHPIGDIVIAAPCAMRMSLIRKFDEHFLHAPKYASAHAKRVESIPAHIADISL